MIVADECAHRTAPYMTMAGSASWRSERDALGHRAFARNQTWRARDTQVMKPHNSFSSSVVVAAALGCGSCAGPAFDWDPSHDGDGFARHAVVCAPGAGEDGDSGNARLAALCDEMPGLVRRCDDGVCSPFARGVDAIGEALDFVAATVPGDTVVSVVGYSWGGVDAVDAVARRTGGEQPGAHVDALVLIDPFAPFRGALVAPPAARRVVDLRHSESNDDDCSLGMPLSPYRGLSLACDDDSVCDEVDFSTEGSGDPAFNDHCAIVDAVGGIVWSIVLPVSPSSTPDATDPTTTFIPGAGSVSASSQP